MIDQLWYTWARTGLRHTEGMQPRAASRGLMAMHGERYRALAPLLAFALPPGVDPYQFDAASAPRSLTLADTGQDWVLVHRTIVDGRDPSGRPITHFTHVLAGLEPDAAREAIALWCSPFWRAAHRELPANQLELDPVELAELEPGPLSPDALRRSGLAEPLAWLIQAHCELPPERQIVLAAPPDTVAVLIYGLSLSLPRDLLGGLTFTTWAPPDRLETTPARVAGTCWWRGTESSLTEPGTLPASLQQRGLTLNLLRPRSPWPRLSAGSPAARYAHFAAVDCLGAGRLAPLETFRALAEEHGVDTAADLFDLFRLMQEGVSGDDIPAITANPALARLLLRQEAVQDALLQGVAGPAKWWPEPVNGALRRLRADPAMTRTLSPLRERAVHAAALQTDHGRTQGADRLLALAEALSDGGAAVAARLFDEVDPERLERDQLAAVRPWLLARSAPAAAQIPHERLTPWFPRDWEEARALAGLDLPAGWRRLLLTQLISRTASSDRLSGSSLAPWLAELPPVLSERLRQPSGDAVVAGFLAAARSSGDAEWSSLLGEVLSATEITPAAAEQLLGRLNLTPTQLAELIAARLDGQRASASWSSGWTAVVRCWFAALSWREVLSAPPAALNLLAAQVPPLDDGSRQALNNWLAVAGFLAHPRAERAALERFGIAALELRPSAEDVALLRESLAPALAASAGSAQQLALVAEQLGNLLWGNPWKLVLALLAAEPERLPARERLYRDLTELYAAPDWVCAELERRGIVVQPSTPRGEQSAAPASGSEPNSEAAVAAEDEENESPGQEQLRPAETIECEARLWAGLSIAGQWPAVIDAVVFQAALAGYLDGVRGWDGDDAPDSELLHAILAGPIPLDDGLRRAIEDRLEIGEALCRPPLTARPLARLCTAIKRSTLTSEERAELGERLMAEIARQVRFADDLARVLPDLAGALQFERWDLLLIGLAASRAVRARRSTITLLAYAAELLSRMDGVTEGEESALRDAVDRLDGRTHRQLRAAVKNWNLDQRVAWHNLMAGERGRRYEPGRPRRVWRRLPLVRPAPRDG